LAETDDIDWSQLVPPKRNGRRAESWCDLMSAWVDVVSRRLRGREVAGKIPEETRKRVDWLAVAIGNLGGIESAALAVGVSKQTVYTWLDKGLARTEFSRVAALAEKGDVPLEYLSRRLGPWKDEAEDESENGSAGK